MPTSIHDLIAAISPNIFCDPKVRSRVKDIVKEKGYLAAAEIAKPVKEDYIDLKETRHISPFLKLGIKYPISKFSLTYDMFGENLEPIYFWLIDIIEEEGKKIITVDKIVDNFISSPGSAHFSEMGMKATKMQEEAMKILGVANQVVRTILNLVYDLKEFKIRLGLYDKLKSENNDERQGALLSLKQIWLDQVDIKRGNTSVKALALGQGAQFVTLIDAFMTAENEKLEHNGQEIDLNDRVKRILKQKILEFNVWKKESELELRKRFEIEKTYLRSQVNSVKLYARWAKPYLKAAHQLEQNATPTSGLVNAFSTSLFELTLMAVGDYSMDEEIGLELMPMALKDIKQRKYYSIMIVEMNFRASPGKVGQNYAFRGKLDLNFTSYALNEEELKVLREELEKDDLGDVMRLVEGATSESLEQLNKDIEEFLGEGAMEKKEEIKEKDSADVNPFTALWSIFKGEEKKKKDLSRGIKLDTDVEEIVRSQTIIQGKKDALKIYGMFKKAHKMPAF